MKKTVAILLAMLISMVALPVLAAEFVPSVLQQTEKPTIAVIIGGEGAIRSNEKAITAIKTKLAEKFPANQYNLIIDDQLAQDILIFAEDEEVEDLEQIKRTQLAKFGESRHDDYVIMLLLGLGHGRAGVDFWSAKYNIDVDMQAKVVEVATGKYIYRKNIMGHGKSSAPIGLPSSVNAFAKATQSCVEAFCKEVEISPIKPQKEAATEEQVPPVAQSTAKTEPRK